MKYATITIDQSVGYITFAGNRPNLDSPAVRVDVLDSLSQLSANDAVRMIVLCGPRGGLSTAARPTHEDQLKQSPSFCTMLRVIDSSQKPIVILLSGAIRGTLFDLAIATHYRLADANVQLQLQGWRLIRSIAAHGTTQRLPRLVGAQTAMDILFGKPFSAQDAVDAKLLDGIARADLKKGAQGYIARVLKQNAHRKPTLHRRLPLESVSQFQSDVISAKESETSRLARRVIDCVEASHVLPADVGLEFEVATLGEFEDLPEFQPLHRLQTATLAKRPVSPEDVPQVCLLGATDQSLKLLRHLLRMSVPASLFIPNPDHLKRVRQEWLKRLTERERSAWGEKRVTSDMAALPCDLVIDTQSYANRTPNALYEFVGAHLARDTSIAFTSLGRPIGYLAGCLPDYHVCGLSLTRDMSLLEWRGNDACKDAIDSLAGALGIAAIKSELDASDCAHRLEDILFYVAECQMAQGISPWDIDAAFVEQGWRLGPLGFAQRVGLKSYANRQSIFQSELPDGAQRPGLTEKIMATKDVTVAYWTERDGKQILHPAIPEGNNTPANGIFSQFHAALCAVGAQLLDDGILRSASDLDLLSRHGLGYPVRTGGVLTHAEQFGVSKLLNTLEQWDTPAFTISNTFAEAAKVGAFHRGN